MGTGSTVGGLVYKTRLFLKPMGASILVSALLEILGQSLAYSCTIPASFSIVTGHQGYACPPHSCPLTRIRDSFDFNSPSAPFPTKVTSEVQRVSTSSYHF